MPQIIPGNPPDLAREQSYPTPYQNSSLLPLLLLSLATQKHQPDTSCYISKEYDYVIVGAGSGGSVVASRLTELESVTVLLLEAGPPAPLLTEVPVISRSFGATDIDWYFFTEPQKYTARLHGNRQAPYSSGKTIGGSSVINSMIYSRGSPENYDEWAAQGAEGWDWEEVFRNFIKAEDNRDPEFYKNGYHGVGGPMTVERFQLERIYADPLIKAQKRLGYPYVDPNGPSQIGAADFQGNLRHGQRCSTAKAYLVPAENRTNLDIVAEAYVTKAILSIIKCHLDSEEPLEILTKGKRATGVRFDHKGASYEIKARREVIVSAGAFNTPKLLMLSGIGPKKTLKKFGRGSQNIGVIGDLTVIRRLMGLKLKYDGVPQRIPVVADLPVGLNLHSHVGPIAFFKASDSIPPFLDKIEDPKNIRKYINSRKGILASCESIFGLSFLKADPLSEPLFVPDYEVYYSEVVLQGLELELNFGREVYEQVFRRYENGTNLMCFVLLQQPRSRGYVTLRSTDPFEYPVIQPNHLKDPEDVRLSVAGLKECYKVLGTPEMRKLGIKPLPTLIPGCEKFYRDEDLYLECVARAFVFPGVHPVGTAKMGDPHDPTTVVDPELRVKGIKGLRVVDASIAPITPTGNTNNIVVMIAEKASGMIKRDIQSHTQWRHETYF